MKTKICSKCKKELPIEQFNKHKETKSGLDCWCKSCKNKSTKRCKKEVTNDSIA